MLHVVGAIFETILARASMAPMPFSLYVNIAKGRLAPVLITIFHQCVISYTCSQSNSDGSVFYRIIRVRLATSI